MIGPILVAALAGAALVTVLGSRGGVAWMNAARGAGGAESAPREAVAATPTTLVTGVVTLTPRAGDPPSNALDVLPCNDVVVAATDAAGQVLASTHARSGSGKGECIYSLKVPADRVSHLAVQPLSTHRPGITLTGRAPDSRGTAFKAQKGATAFSGGIRVAPAGATAFKGQSAFKNATLYKFSAGTGPVRQNLNAIFVFEATRPQG